MYDYTDPEVLKHLYHDKKMSMNDIASACDVGRGTIQYHMNVHEIDRRPKNTTLRKSEIYTDSRGRECFFENGDKVDIHRLIMVAECGIDEVRESGVYFKNGIRWDHRRENMELRDRPDIETRRADRWKADEAEA